MYEQYDDDKIRFADLTELLDDCSITSDDDNNNDNECCDDVNAAVLVENEQRGQHTVNGNETTDACQDNSSIAAAVLRGKLPSRSSSSVSSYSSSHKGHLVTNDSTSSNKSCRTIRNSILSS
jgi:hypothetical protein